MNPRLIFCALYASCGFSTWSQVTSRHGLNWEWSAIIVGLLSFLIPAGIATFTGGISSIPETRKILWGVVAGCLNGTAFAIYNMGLASAATTDPGNGAARYVTLVMILLVLFGFIGGIFILGAKCSLQKVLGMAIILAGILVLSKAK